MSAPVEERTTEQVEAGDHDRFSHYVRNEAMMESLTTGQPARAICGKLWVVTRDGKAFPICPECEELYLQMKDE